MYPHCAHTLRAALWSNLNLYASSHKTERPLRWPLDCQSPDNGGALLSRRPTREFTARPLHWRVYSDGTVVL